MQNKILADAINEYIYALRQLVHIAGLLETHKELTPKQKYDATKAIERLTRIKTQSESTMLGIIDSVSAEDRHEWALLLEPYMQEV